MIQKFVDRFMAYRHELENKYKMKHPEGYHDIVHDVVELLHDENDYGSIDPKRIHVMNDGDYQGTLLFVIGADNYQPDVYWAVKIGYGSCSGCDMYQRVRGYDDDPPTVEQTADYMMMALHVVQGLKEI